MLACDSSIHASMQSCRKLKFDLTGAAPISLAKAQEITVATYTLRLFKRSGSPKNLYHTVQTISIDAASDEEAIEKARVAQIPAWDDSDMALLFTQTGQQVWRLDA